MELCCSMYNCDYNVCSHVWPLGACTNMLASSQYIFTIHIHSLFMSLCVVSY